MMSDRRAARHIFILGGYTKSLVIFRGPLLKALVAAGHRVTVAAGEDDREVAEVLAKWGVTFRPVPLARAGLNPFADLRTLLELRRLMREIRPDIFLGYTIKPATYGILAARLAGVSSRYAMLTGLGYAFTEGPELKRKLSRLIASALYRLALPFARRVIFQNPDDEHFFARQGFVRPARAVRVHGSGVDTQHFDVAPLPDGPITFLMIARLLRDKGVYEYVEAARRVKAARPEIRFVLVGPLDPNPSGVSREELEAWVSEGIVSYGGEVSDVRPHIRACHIYVLPSYREGMPRTVLEAMAMGRPVITCDVPGCRETVTDGDNGRLVPARDAAALADAMLAMSGDRDALVEQAQRSRARVMRDYDVDTVNATMLEILLGDDAAAGVVRSTG
jgi:glycosyltransferase involved in cell wall biosynthesis